MEEELKIVNDKVIRQQVLQPNKVHKKVDQILTKINNKYKEGLKRNQIEKEITF